jgi:hypothetical protein
MIVKKLVFSVIKWKLAWLFLVVTQFCKTFSSHLNCVLFDDNFFINALLFKDLITMNIRICDTIKINSDNFIELIIIRATVIKQKDWDKMRLMIVKSDKKMNIDDENVLCMIWLNLNIVQYMIKMQIIDEIKTIVFNDA